MSDRTRWQIMFTVPRGTPEPPIENFTAAQKKQLDARVKALTAAQVTFKVWDTQRNPLSGMF